MERKISIVVPTYDRLKAFIKLIESIKSSNIPKDMYEILVVSSDIVDSPKVEWINNQTDIDITLILEADRTTVRNRSLYYYENIGIKKSKYDWVLVCNDDMWVEPDWYENFLSYVNDDNKVYLVSSHIGTKGLGFRIPELSVGSTMVKNGVSEVLWLFDMSIIHKSIYEEIGYLDENISWYGKGADLSLSIGLLTDEKPILCHNVKIHHDIDGEHRKTNINGVGRGDFKYIREKWDKWVEESDKDYQFNSKGW